MSIAGFFVIIRGPLGAGKSTIAKRLSKELSARCIEIDSMLAAHGLDRDTENGYVSQRSFIAANKLAVSEAMPLLQQRVPVVFEGNFYWKSQLDDLIQRLPFPHFAFTLTVPLETCVSRDSGRAAPLGKDAVVAVFRKSTEFSYGLPIDAIGTPEDAVRCIQSCLSSQWTSSP